MKVSSSIQVLATPDETDKQQLNSFSKPSDFRKQDISQGNQVSEETTQAAAALYLELKRCLRGKNFKQFKKTLDEAALLCPKFGCTV